jgi:uncharacterized membrane protein YfcA
VTGVATDSLFAFSSAVFVAAAAFLGSMASAITGAGGAVIVSLALAPLMGVAAMVQIVTVAMVVSHVARVGAFRSDIDWPSAGLVLASAAPGCIVGSLIYVQLDERTIAVVLAAFLVFVVAAKRLMPKDMGRLPRPVLAMASFMFGLMSGTTIGGGMLVLPILIGAGLAGMRLVGTDAAIGLVVHLVKALVFAAGGALTLELFALGLVVGAVMIPGAWAAKWIVKRMPLRVHAALIDAVILIGAATFFLRAVRS